jgi:AcrR family transcriptional regulator
VQTRLRIDADLGLPPEAVAARTARGPYRTGIRRRQQIIEAATLRFAQRGYLGASLRDIANDVGVSAAAILRHFGSKEELLGAVVLEWWDQEGVQFGPHADLGLAYFLQYPELMRQHEEKPGWIELYLTVAGEATQPEYPVRDIIARRFASIVDTGLRQLQVARDRGEIRAMTDEEIVQELRGLYAMMDGLELQWLIGGEFELGAEFNHQFVHILRRWGVDPALAGLSPDPASVGDRAEPSIGQTSEAPDGT